MPSSGIPSVSSCPVCHQNLASTKVLSDTTRVTSSNGVHSNLHELCRTDKLVYHVSRIDYFFVARACVCRCVGACVCACVHSCLT